MLRLFFFDELKKLLKLIKNLSHVGIKHYCIERPIEFERVNSCLKDITFKIHPYKINSLEKHSIIFKRRGMGSHLKC